MGALKGLACPPSTAGAEYINTEMGTPRMERHGDGALGSAVVSQERLGPRFFCTKAPCRIGTPNAPQKDCSALALLPRAMGSPHP